MKRLDTQPGNVLTMKGYLISLFEECLKRKADYPPAIAGIAQAYNMLEDYKRALVHVEKYKVLDPA